MRPAPQDRTVRIDRAFCQKLPVERLLVRLLADALRDCKATEGTLWTFSDDGLHLEASCNNGDKEKVIEQLSVPLTASIVGMVATSGMAMCIGPDDARNLSVELATGIPVRAMAASPVYHLDQICGVLSIVNPLGGGLFQAQELETLQWKSYLMGLILEDCSGP